MKTLSLPHNQVSPMRNKLILTGVLLFVFGLPTAGVIYFWNDMKGKIEVSADKFAEETSRQILTDWNSNQLYDEGTTAIKDKDFESKFSEWKSALGKPTKIGAFKVVKTWAEPRNDMMWQLVQFETPITFEKGTATLHAVVARKTVGPRWRFESFNLVPAR